MDLPAPATFLTPTPTEASTSANVMQFLDSATHGQRARVAEELNMMGDHVSWLDYRLFLFRMYGFHISVERALSGSLRLSNVIADADLRNNKVALLAHDLIALGVQRRDLQLLPRMAVPTFRELADAIGWIYVVERSTLDARELAVHLRKQLPLELEIAGAYVSCYGDEVEARWQELSDAIEHYAATTSTVSRIAAAAGDCLTKLHRWVRPVSLDSTVRASDPVIVAE